MPIQKELTFPKLACYTSQTSDDSTEKLEMPLDTTLPAKGDSLGDRMKAYEKAHNKSFESTEYLIVRVDGRAFHTYTRGLKKSPGCPWNPELENVMNKTAVALCEQIQGAKMAYVQSDEISILVSKGDKETSQIWFGGNLQKIVSLSASVASVTFSLNSGEIWDGEIRPALFDSRIFSLPNKIEVSNYFIWRQQDQIRNAVQMMARTLFSQKVLHKVPTSQLHKMVEEKGHAMENQTLNRRFGRTIVKQADKWCLDTETPNFISGRDYILTKF